MNYLSPIEYRHSLGLYEEIFKGIPKTECKTAARKCNQSRHKKKADSILQGIHVQIESKKERDALSEMGKYLIGNWESIIRRKTLDIPGSCTEAQVSHILSERFSRGPIGWSEEGLGKLAKLRVYVKNGGKITNKDFKSNGKSNVSYKEYADKVIEETITGAIDWSILEPEAPIFNGASGTQVLTSSYGSIKGHLIN